MDITPDTVKAWLSRYPERDRNWLAEKCGAEKGTVDNWLSTSRGIPSKAIRIIEGLMRADAETEPGPALAEIPLPATCTMEQFDLYTRAFRYSEQEHFRDWITTRLEAAAEAELSESFKAPTAAATTDHFPDAKKMVPHLAAAAGPGIEAEVVETLDHTIRVRICGLSMDPLFADGDIIAMHSRVASRSPFMKKGLIYLVRIDGSYAVKRFNTRKPTAEEAGEEWAAKGRVGLLESINPAFAPITIKSEIEWLAWLDPKEV